MYYLFHVNVFQNLCLDLHRKVLSVIKYFVLKHDNTMYERAALISLLLD